MGAPSSLSELAPRRLDSPLPSLLESAPIATFFGIVQMVNHTLFGLFFMSFATARTVSTNEWQAESTWIGELALPISSTTASAAKGGGWLLRLLVLLHLV